jgi:hypothetical protein
MDCIFSIEFWQRQRLKKQASPAKTRMCLIPPSRPFDECLSSGIANLILKYRRNIVETCLPDRQVWPTAEIRK